MFRRNIIPLLAATLLFALAAPALAKAPVDKDGRTIWPKDTLDMTVRATDELSGVESVELWWRKDGGKWQRWLHEPKPTDKEGQFKFAFKAPDDGVYEFYSVSVDSVGNSSEMPDDKTTPMATIHFDFHAPVLSVNYRNTEARVRPGGTISFEWSAADSSLRSVRAKYYYNGDSSKVQHKSLDSAEGSYHLEVPTEGVKNVTIQIVAEDYAGFKNETKPLTFTIEETKEPVKTVKPPEPVAPERETVAGATAPEPRDMQPRPAAPKPFKAPSKTAQELPERNPLRVVIKYNVVENGLSGLDRVELWVTRVNGNDWKKNWFLHEFSHKAKGQFVYDAPEIGRYGFYIVAGNRAGAWSKTRPDGKAAVEPDYTRWIDPYEPFVKIISPRKGEILRGGSVVRIRWVASDDNLLDKPIKIELMRNGASVMIVANAAENDGEYEFEFPYSKGAYSVRISATDRAGHVTADDTGEFLIDTGVPRVSIEIMDDDGNALPVAVRAPEPEQEASYAPAPVQETVEQKPEKPVKKAFPQKTAGPKPADADEHMLRGRELLEMGQIESAITELAKASEYFPINAAIINEYGIALFRKKMYMQALLNFQRAKELAPGETRYLWNTFLAYYKLDNADAAAQSALLVLNSDGVWEEGRNMIDAVMLMHQKKGQTDKIAEFLEQVLKIEHLSEAIEQHIRAKTE